MMAIMSRAFVNPVPKGGISKMGRTGVFVDGKIAAVAKVNGLILVTRNP